MQRSSRLIDFMLSLSYNKNRNAKITSNIFLSSTATFAQVCASNNQRKYFLPKGEVQ